MASKNSGFYRLGLGVVRYRWLVIGLWTAFLALGLALAPRVSTVLKAGGFSLEESEAQQVLRTLEKELNYSTSSVTLVFSSPTLTVEDPAFLQAVQDQIARLEGLPAVQGVVTLTQNPRLV